MEDTKEPTKPELPIEEKKTNRQKKAESLEALKQVKSSEIEESINLESRPPIAVRDSQGRFLKGSKPPAMDSYKKRLNKAIREEGSPQELASIVWRHARQTNDARLSMEAAKELMDRTLGKALQQSVSKHTSKHTQVSLDLSCLPLEEQEAYLAMTAKLLSNEGANMGKAWGEEAPQEAEIVEKPLPEATEQQEGATGEEPIEPPSPG